MIKIRRVEVQKQVDKAEEHEQLLKDQNDKLKESLGYSSELADLFMAGGVMALGAKAFTEGIEKAKGAFTETYDTALDLYKTIGLSAGEAAGLANSIQGASMFSLTVSAQDAKESAATAMSDAFGTTQHINAETLKDVAELTNLLGDGAGAVKLQEIFEQAGVDASDMTSEIKDIAAGVGVNAAAVLKDMASQQNQMLGMSKEEIKIMAQKSAELVKQGLSMDKLRGMSDNMLNIEGNIAAQMKARQFGLGEMLPDQQAMFAAANELQYGDAQKGAEMMTAALKESGITAESFGSMGFKQQQIYAEAIGMSADELGNMLQTQEKNAELTRKVWTETGAKVYGYVSRRSY